MAIEWNPLLTLGATPIDVTSGVNTLGTAASVAQRPNLVLGVPIYLNGPDNTKHEIQLLLRCLLPGSVGSLGKGSIRGKSITNVDFSLNKNWRIKERYGIQFRAEMFNALNHPNFVGFDTALNFQGNSKESTFGTPQNGAFGTLTAAQSHREIQFGFKFTFVSGCGYTATKLTKTEG